MKQDNNNTAFTNLSLEQALEKLEVLSRSIESSEYSFEDSLKLYEEAKELSVYIEKKLAGYKKKLEFFGIEFEDSKEESSEANA